MSLVPKTYIENPNSGAGRLLDQRNRTLDEVREMLSEQGVEVEP